MEMFPTESKCCQKIILNDLAQNSNIGIFKGAHLDQSQPVPLRGFETFCYGAPKMCAEFWGGAKKQPVPWYVGTG